MWLQASNEVEGSAGAPGGQVGVEPREEESGQSGRPARTAQPPGEMAGGIAHDFRNILGVIQSSLNLLERVGGDADKAAYCLAAAREGIERGLRLTARLVDSARKVERIPGLVSVNELLAEFQTLLKHGAGAGIDIHLDLAPDLPQCRIDPSRFCSAILNLMLNARDSMPDGGIVRISTAIAEPEFGRAGRFVRIRVRDEGIGMSPEVAGRIFDSYFTTKGESGTGLGIPQVCAFARRAGGEVRVASKPGAGTIFDLLLPAEPAGSPLWRQIDRWLNEGGALGGFREPQRAPAIAALAGIS